MSRKKNKRAFKAKEDNVMCSSFAVIEEAYILYSSFAVILGSIYIYCIRHLPS